MIQLSLSEADAVLLRDALETRLRDLRMEISHTDSPRFRSRLNDIEAMLQRLIVQLPAAPAASAE